MMEGATQMGEQSGFVQAIELVQPLHDMVPALFLLASLEAAVEARLPHRSRAGES
jgi:hypothetical protein